jgi:hypothetical protein
LREKYAKNESEFTKTICAGAVFADDDKKTIKQINLNGFAENLSADSVPANPLRKSVIMAFLH